MRTSIVSALAIASFTTAFALPTPAAAMELREAIKRCDASPGCTYTLDKSGATIFGPKGGVVSCPPKEGECAVIGKTKGGKPGRGTVTGVMAGSVKGQGKISSGTTKGTAAGNHPVATKQVADRSSSRMQTESHSSSTGSGGGGKRH